MSQSEFFAFKDSHGYTVWVNVAQIASVLFKTPSNAQIFAGSKEYTVEQAEGLNKLMDVLTSHQWEAE